MTDNCDALTVVDVAGPRAGQCDHRDDVQCPGQLEECPDVLGGLVIRVGDEVIDGSIAHRLEAAGRRLAG